MGLWTHSPPPRRTLPAPHSSHTFGKRHLPAPSSRSAPSGLLAAVGICMARVCMFLAFREGKSSLWRPPSERRWPKVDCCPCRWRCVGSERLCSPVPFITASVVLRPSATALEPRSFLEVDSGGGYSRHPELISYTFTPAEIFGRSYWHYLLAVFCRLPGGFVCHHHPHPPSPQVLGRKGPFLSLTNLI